MRGLYKYGGTVLGAVSLSPGELKAPLLDELSKAPPPMSWAAATGEGARAAPATPSSAKAGFFSQFAWWQFALGGVGLAAIGYGVYRTVR